MSEVLVLAELTPSGVRTATLELLTLARRLGEPSAVVCGIATDDVVAALGSHGATTVYVASAPEIEQFLSVPKAEVLVSIAQRVDPAAVLVTSGPEGKDVAARVAVRLGSGLVTDAVDVVAEGGVVRDDPVRGRRVLPRGVRSQVVRGIPVVTVRPNAVAAEAAAPAQPRVENVDVQFSDLAKGATVTSRTPKTSSERPDLADAAVVVAGGRGIGSEAASCSSSRLADALGGAVGATRAPPPTWSGACATTRSARPARRSRRTLYLASGVSGAIQHRAGMQASQHDRRGQQGPQGPDLRDLRTSGSSVTCTPCSRHWSTRSSKRRA